MSAVRNALKRLRSEESGLSMAELLVAGILTVIVFAMFGQMFMVTAKLTTSGNQIADSTGNASNASNSITSVVRVATNLAQQNSTTPALAILDGSNSTTLSIYALYDTKPTDPAPSKVTYTYVPPAGSTAGYITETRCKGTASGAYYPVGNFTTCTPFRTIGTNISFAGSSEVLFTYKDVNGTPMTISGGKLSATQRGQVASIVVTVRSNPNPSQIRPVIVSNTVVLRNIGLDTGT